MNYKMMLRIHAWILMIETILMLPALIITCVESDRAGMYGFLETMGIAMLLAGITAFLSRKAERKFYAREGLVCTGLAWLVLSLVGALPFFLSGRIPHYIDAFFEIVSGFTTTGASILG